jgi:hypothetical protein
MISGLARACQPARWTPARASPPEPCPLPRWAGGRRPLVEDRDPAAGAMVTQGNAKILVRHADDDEPETGSGIEPTMDEGKLRCLRLDEHGRQSRTEAPASVV